MGNRRRPGGHPQQTMHLTKSKRIQGYGSLVARPDIQRLMIPHERGTEITKGRTAEEAEIALNKHNAEVKRKHFEHQRKIKLKLEKEVLLAKKRNRERDVLKQQALDQEHEIFMAKQAKGRTLAQQRKKDYYASLSVHHYQKKLEQTLKNKETLLTLELDTIRKDHQIRQKKREELVSARLSEKQNKIRQTSQAWKVKLEHIKSHEQKKREDEKLKARETLARLSVIEVRRARVKAKLQESNLSLTQSIKDRQSKVRDNKKQVLSMSQTLRNESFEKSLSKRQARLQAHEVRLAQNLNKRKQELNLRLTKAKEVHKLKKQEREDRIIHDFNTTTRRFSQVTANRKALEPTKTVHDYTALNGGWAI